MSSHYEWGQASTALYHVVTRDSAPEQWNVAPAAEESVGDGVSAPYALGLFTESGDGTVVEGEAGEILDFVDKLHAYAHRELDAVVGGEAETIPGQVWRAFLVQETHLDDEHPGPVSLPAVVGELRRLMAGHSPG